MNNIWVVCAKCGTGEKNLKIGSAHPCRLCGGRVFNRAWCCDNCEEITPGGSPCQGCGFIDNSATEVITIELTKTMKGKASSMLWKAQKAKKDHRGSSQCEMKNGKGCTACHFWSGSIAALSELLGNPGIID